ncbi:carboxymuconolactone decarboxylase family protein [Spirillospora sp. CA-128828]|uniref:carboxymuconolactone decarboxylase family protein n=1 Tax=Spirillospora sp. CA-128828 TaxID=3240033 RepID=UPI003D8B2B03
MAVINSGLLSKTTIDLVLLRASQINGCGFCTDIHSKDLAHAGRARPIFLPLRPPRRTQLRPSHSRRRPRRRGR